MTPLSPARDGQPIAVPATKDGEPGHVIDGQFLPDNFLLDLARQVKYRQHDEAMEKCDEE